MNWSEVLLGSFDQLWGGVIIFIPKLIVAVVVFIIGWVIAVTLGKFVAQLVRAIKVDKALRAVGFEEPLARAGFRLDAGVFIGALVRWFFIIVFLMASLDVLGLSQINVFLKDDVLGYLPRVISAVLILVVAAFVASAMQKVIVGSAKAAGVPSTNLLGGVAKWAIWTFAILVALYQLGIAGVFAQTIFTGFVAMLAIGGGLAFGLGGKETAARFLEKMRGDISNNQ